MPGVVGAVTLTSLEVWGPFEKPVEAVDLSDVLTILRASHSLSGPSALEVFIVTNEP